MDQLLLTTFFIPVVLFSALEQTCVHVFLVDGGISEGHKRLKGTLFIRTKQNMQILGG